MHPTSASPWFAMQGKAHDFGFPESESVKFVAE
jgi:hypothetical protein